uniref:Uncharacterized protein n=1 Tax=Oryza nivara TaxID=4536 RepID=A0A0E0IW44_ORYNI
MASNDDRVINLAGGRLEEENLLGTKTREMDKINIPSRTEESKKRRPDVFQRAFPPAGRAGARGTAAAPPPAAKPHGARRGHLRLRAACAVRRREDIN